MKCLMRGDWDLDARSPVLAVDPGNEETAFVVWDGVRLVDFGKVANADAAARFRMISPMTRKCVIEKIASYGMAVGESVFETCVWTGRFMEIYGPDRVERMPRLNVKMHLCHDSKAKDANIRQAIIDRFGGKMSIGNKKSPGPLYGVSKDVWSALAIALTWWDKNVG